MFIDSHCHLDSSDFHGDLDVLVKRAIEIDVGIIVNVGTKILEFNKILELVNQYDNVYCTVGLHPHEVTDTTVANIAQLVTMSEHPKVIGFGETGLDYFYNKKLSTQQQISFRNHIKASRITGLPIIIHTRDADEDTISILIEEATIGPYSGLIHCFNSDQQFAKKVIALGLYISLSGIITFNNAENLRETVRGLQLDRLLIETDAPFLTPVPNRGLRNEPAFIVHTAKKLAELKNLELSDIATITTENFFRLFTKILQ
ncbi:MAG: TatD family hydrolase [Rhodospirillaceae bacterium]|jgi:TatD DNase family protein|nr:TatD family hydrolase [Rhodospirillaceae bacterium]